MGLPARQEWLEAALQGLAFWIGHRQSLFRFYPLSEGALVAEACNLIQSNLPKDLVLVPECMYRNLVTGGAAPSGITALARADLVIREKSADADGRDQDLASSARFVIEMKRGNAAKSLIDGDLFRLHAFLTQANAEVRGFLVLVGESRAPARFVADGRSILGAHPIPNTTGHYRVRRTVKAAASFSGKSTAHYVCLVEVFVQGKKALPL